MMKYVSPFLRKLVIRRAGNRCEYCQLSQEGQEATFHIDHIVPLAVGGQTAPENLALACVSCSLKKGAKEFVRLRGGEKTRLFNPRIDKWRDHFEWKNTILAARSELGNAMIALLDLNRPIILAIREEEKYLKRHPLKK
jgi:hypothetical protein